MRDYIVTHPDNIPALKSGTVPMTGKLGNILELSGFDGIQLRTDENMPKTTGQAEFPPWRFVEWEDKDAAWAIPAGIAKIVQVPCFMLISTPPMNWNPYR